MTFYIPLGNQSVAQQMFCVQSTRRYRDCLAVTPPRHRLSHLVGRVYRISVPFSSSNGRAYAVSTWITTLYFCSSCPRHHLESAANQARLLFSSLSIFSFGSLRLFTSVSTAASWTSRRVFVTTLFS